MISFRFPVLLHVAGALLFPVGLMAGEVITLDFNDPSVTGYNFCMEEGFHLKAAGRIGASMQTGIVAYNGTRVVPVLSNLPPVTVAHIDRLPFAPLRVDISEYSTFSRPPGNVVTVQAAFGDGRTESHAFTLDGVIDGSQGALADFETFTFPAGWRDVVELRFTVSGITLDNLVVEGTRVPDAPVPPLPNGVRNFQIVATLPSNSAAWNRWSIHRVRGEEVLLAELSSGGAPRRQFHVPSLSLSPSEGPVPNPWTGERAESCMENVPDLDEQYVPAFYLLPNPADDEERILLYRDSYPSKITRPSLMVPENGRVAFVSHGYGGVEKYAVFIVESGRLIPVVKPDTVLPDGGFPFHYPYQLYFEDQAVAFPSSTTLASQQDCWFLQFPGRALLFGLPEGAVPPGYTEPITSLGKLVSLNRERASYYVHGETRSWLMEANRNGEHRVLGATGPELTGRPVAGCGMRGISGNAMTSIDPVTGVAFYGWAARADERGADVPVSMAESPGKLLPVCAGQHSFPGLNAPACLYVDHVSDGRCWSVVMDGTRNLLVKFTAVPQKPEPRLGGILTMPDGSRRVVAEYLTLDSPVTVETSESLAGPWVSGAQIWPGSISRLVPVPFDESPRRFMRLRYSR